MQNKLTILLYHGVTDHKSEGIENTMQKHIARDVFRQQMQWIHEQATVLTMDDVVAVKQAGRDYPSGAVAVTFDDGFQNNYTQALPILEEFRIPATFYISAGMIGTERMFWVDILEDCINRTCVSGFHVTLEKTMFFPLQGHADKIKALGQIKSYCKQVTANEKNRIVDEVSRLTKVSADVESSPNYQKLTWPQVQAMASHELCCIAGHSMAHDILTRLDPEQMRADIIQSIHVLSKKTHTAITHYSYPEGQAEHYDDHVIRILQDQGILCCPSAIDGINDGSEDLFHLKRIMVGFQGRVFPYELANINS